jgi:integrase
VHPLVDVNRSVYGIKNPPRNTPHFTSEVIAGILKSSKGYKQMFCALLGGTGLRAGEAIGLEIDKHISEDFRTLYIRQKVRRTKLYRRV